MAVNITWSLTEEGTSVTSLDHGSGSNGDLVANGGGAASGLEIYVRHDGTNNITDAGFYIAPKTGTYGGGFNATDDYAELLAWGDGDNDDYGGFEVNMNSSGVYPDSDWPVSGTKQPTYGSAFYTGVGDTVDNKVLLAITMGVSVPSEGVLTSGLDARFKCRVRIPPNEDTVGVREFDQKLRYTYTS